ncbi:oligosaccharide flippase family protein [Patescibacteria group bacterium]|nr:oligosaccharide flippase family protein [Patescibacteria group bacterium]
MATFFILARILVPADYGVMAVTMFMVGLLDKVTEPGFGDALVQRKESVEKYLDAVWTFDLIRYGILSGLLMFGGGWIASFFHLDASQAMIVRAGGILLILGALSNIRMVNFARGLEYKKILIRDIASQIALGGIAIVVALTVSASPWALFAGQLGLYIVGLTFSYLLMPVRPRIDFNFGKLRDLFGFGKWVYVQNLLDYVFQYFDKLFIGRMLDPNTLGLYSRGKDLGGLVTGIIQSLIGKIAFPALSRVQGEIHKVQQGFLKSIDVLIILAVPAGLLLSLQGGVIVSFLLGDKWIALTLILKIFAIGNLIVAVNAIFQTVFASLGRPEVNVGLHLLQFALTIPAAWLGFQIYHAPGLAMGVIATWVVTLGASWFMAGRVFRIGMPSLRPAFWSVLSASLAVFLLDLLARNAVLATGNTWIGMGWVACLGAVYLFVMFGVSRVQGAGPWYTAISVAKELGILPKILRSKI